MFRYLKRRLCCLLAGALMLGTAQAQVKALAPTGTSTTQVAINLPIVPLAPSLVLSGTGSFTSGNRKEQGSVTLRVTPKSGYEETWTVKGGPDSFKLDGVDGQQNCQTTDASGSSKPVYDQRCLRIIPWFAPWTAPAMVASGHCVQRDVTTEADKAAGHTRQRFSIALPNTTVKPETARRWSLISERSSIEIVYDARTLQPVRMDYSDSIDNDPSRTIDTYVLYSEYREELGVMMPHRIQKYLQRTLLLDLPISAVTAY